MFGEIGLAGEVRPAPRGQDRLKEAAKLGFEKAIVPQGQPAEGEDRRNRSDRGGAGGPGGPGAAEPLDQTAGGLRSMKVLRWCQYG